MTLWDLQASSLRPSQMKYMTLKYYKHDTSSSFINYSALNGEHKWRDYIFSEGINKGMYFWQP